MPRVIVDVKLKPEILDPQGRAVRGALARSGITTQDVRQGKQFVIEIDSAPDEAGLAQLHEVAGSLLSNPVIEDYELRIEDGN